MSIYMATDRGTLRGLVLRMIQKTSNRLAYIDAMRGIAIIAVVMGHCNLAVKFVYLFHIPVFMFVSGLLNTHESAASFRELLSRICHVIWKRYTPFIVVEAVFLLFHNFFYYLHWLPEKFTCRQFLSKFVQIVSMGGGESLGGALWFVIVLLEISVCFEIFLLLEKLFHRNFNIIMCLAAAVCFIAGFYVKMPRMFDRACILFLYYAAGHLVRRYDTNILSRLKSVTAMTMSFALLAAIVISSMKVSWSSGNPLLSLLCGIAGITMVYGLAAEFAESRIGRLLSRYGRYSFFIMAYHFLGFKICAAVLTLFGLTNLRIFVTLTPPSYMSFPLLVIFCIAGLEFSCVVGLIWNYTSAKVRKIWTH